MSIATLETTIYEENLVFDENATPSGTVNSNGHSVQYTSIAKPDFDNDFEAQEGQVWERNPSERLIDPNKANELPGFDVSDDDSDEELDV